jgi:C-terminal peptidase prc
MHPRILAIAIVSWVLCAPLALQADTASAVRYIMEHYVHPLPRGSEKLPYTEFDKLLDKWTWIISNEEWSTMANSLQGKHTGKVGVMLLKLPYGERVVHVTAGSPGYFTGLMIGDVVESWGDVSVIYPDTSATAVRRYSPAGQYIILDVRRGDSCMRVPTFRETFTTDAVDVAVRGRTLAVRLEQFTSDMHKNFSMKCFGIDRSSIDTVIFDVRDNGGGYVDAALAMIGEFVKEGDTMLSMHFRNRTEYSIAESTGDWYDPRRTIIILQDSGSASASELFAGGMRERARAIIVGQRSYGKGRVLNRIPARAFGSFKDPKIGGLSITIALYKAAGKIDVDSIGIPASVAFPEQAAAWLPPTVDVIALRNRTRYPSEELIDSINRLGRGNAAGLVWGDLISARVAIDEIASMREMLPVPVWRCLADHEAVHTQFSRQDEELIRRAIYDGIIGSVPDSVLRIEPVEKMLEHLQINIRIRSKEQVFAEHTLAPKLISTLGLRLRQHQNSIVVDHVARGSVAYNAGVCVGDNIVSVENFAAGGSIDRAMALLVNSKPHDGILGLEVRRGNRQFTLPISQSSASASLVTSTIDDDVAYIALHSFSVEAGAQARKNIIDADRQGASSIVIDLRGIAGNNARSAVHLLDLFGKGKPLGASAPYILVDQFTAGAPEYFASRMQREHGAVIVGTATAGRMERELRMGISNESDIIITRQLDTLSNATSISPDIQLTWPERSLDAIRTAASHFRDVVHMRKDATDITDNVLDNIYARIPNAQSIDRGVLSEAIFGSAARYYQIAPIVRRVVNNKRWTRR